MKDKNIAQAVFSVAIAFVAMFCIATTGYCQVQATVGASVSETKNILDSIRNNRTLTADLRINVLNKESNWVLAPAFSYNREYDKEVVMDSEVYPNGIYRDVDTYFGGLEIGRKIAKSKLELGAGFFLGTTEDPITETYKLVRKYRAYFQVNAGHFVFGPRFELEATGGFNTNRVNRYGAYVGVRF